MTEGPTNRHDKPMCVRVWLEVGHECEPCRSSSGRPLALDWRVWVRGARGRDISPFVHKVVFKLHPPSAFVYPKRVIQEPPYEITESGCASIDIPIYVYLKCTNKPKKISLRYSLHIENNNKYSTESMSVYYDFENPSESLYTALMKGGGEVISRVRHWDKPNKLVVLFSDYDDKPPSNVTKPRKYKFIEPVRCKHSRRDTRSYLLEEICSKCGDPINVDFKKHLRAVAMTDEEIARVSQLYLSISNYEKAVNAIILPHFSDPIYRVPELPLSLRGARNSIEVD